MAFKRAYDPLQLRSTVAILRGNLVALAKRSDSPFRITDWSVKERFDENWPRESTRPHRENGSHHRRAVGNIRTRHRVFQQNVTMVQQVREIS